MGRGFVKDRILKLSDGLMGADKYLNGSIGLQRSGLYGTACALLAMIYCGEELGSDHVKSCSNLLRSDMFLVAGGGWATNTIKERCKTGMVDATCYVLNALIEAGTDPKATPVQESLNWLVRSRNPGKRWGRFPADSDDSLTATCNVVATLARAARYGFNVSPSDYADAVEWIKRTQDAQSGGWRGRRKNEPTAGYTAYALLALAEASTGEDSIRKGVRFLLSDVQGWEEELERFRVPTVDRDAHDEEYHIWTEACAVSALIRAHTHPCTERIVAAVEKLIRSQEHDRGYWRDSVGNILSWRVMYGYRALRDFVRALDSTLLVMSGVPEIGEFGEWRDNTARAIQQLSDRVSRLENERGWRYHRRRILRYWPALFGVAFASIYTWAFFRFIAPAMAPGVSPWLVLLFPDLISLGIALWQQIKYVQGRR